MAPCSVVADRVGSAHANLQGRRALAGQSGNGGSLPRVAQRRPLDHLAADASPPAGRSGVAGAGGWNLMIGLACLPSARSAAALPLSQSQVCRTSRRDGIRGRKAGRQRPRHRFVRLRLRHLPFLPCRRPARGSAPGSVQPFLTCCRRRRQLGALRRPHKAGLARDRPDRRHHAGPGPVVAVAPTVRTSRLGFPIRGERAILYRCVGAAEKSMSDCSSARTGDARCPWIAWSPGNCRSTACTGSWPGIPVRRRALDRSELPHLRGTISMDDAGDTVRKMSRRPGRGTASTAVSTRTSLPSGKSH
jgi:hypothetical protein